MKVDKLKLPIGNVNQPLLSNYNWKDEGTDRRDNDTIDKNE